MLARDGYEQQAASDRPRGEKSEHLGEGADGQWLRRALDAAGIGGWRWDLSTGVLAGDSRCYSLLGMPPGAQVSYQQFLGMVHSEDRGRVEADSARAAASPGEYGSEFRIVGRDGSVRWVQVLGRSIAVEGGKPTELTGVAMDVTRRRQDEESLRRFELLASHSRDIVLMMDRDGGRLLEANAAAVQAYGYCREELLGLTIQDLRASPAQRLTAGQMAAADAQGILFETEHRRKDGSTFPVEVSSQGAQVGGTYTLISVIRDISLRRKSEASLRASEEKYRNLFANMAEEVHFWQLVRDEAGNIKTWRLVDANPPTLRTWGRQSVDEIRGKTTDEIFGPGATEHYLPVVQKIMVEGVPYSFEDYFPNLDKHFRFTSVPLGEHFITTGADITAIKKIELALRESEQRFRLALRNAPVSVAVQDRELRYIWAYNQRSARPDQIIGRFDHEIFTPEEVAHITPLKRRVLAEGIELREQMWLARPTGRMFLDICWEPIRNANGEVIGVGSAAVDLTPCKLSEEAMREREERFRSVAENMSEGLMLFDPQGNLIYQNPASLRIHGFPLQDEGRIAHGDLPATWQAWDDQGRPIPFDQWPVSRVFRGERFQNQVLHVLRPETGLEFDASYNGSPIYDDAGRLTLGFITIREITGQRKAEEALRRRAEEIERLLEAVPAAVWVAHDPQCLTITGNRRANEFYEAQAHENVSATLLPEVRRFFTPEGRELSAGELPMQKAAATNRDVRDVELEVQLPSGRRIAMLGNAVPLRNEIGSVRGCIGAFLDITQRKQAEEALKVSLREKEVLLKEIHHRVKNNMQVISSLVDLQKEQLHDPAMRALLQEVTHRVRSMALVHEKLYQSSDLAKVDFAEYAQSLLGYLWRAHGTAASGIRLTLNLQPVELSINAAVPCGLILNELVSNTLKHAFRGRTSGEVTVSLCGSREGGACLRVRDNGAGLPEGFDWRQTDSLGLSIVQILAKQLRAAVDVSSGEGTEFIVKIEERKI